MSTSGVERPARRADCPIEVAPLGFLDIETTGLRPDRGARITEIAMIGRRESLICLKGEEGPFSDAVLAEHLSALFAGFRTRVIVGHHLAFDLGFLAREADRLGCSGPSLRYIDTFPLAKRAGAPRPGYRLSELMAEKELSFEGSFHTALGDARATRALFEALVEDLRIETLGEAGLKRIHWSSF